jgi:hypothetical protein
VAANNLVANEGFFSVRSNALPAFERRSVTCQSINRSLSSFGREFSFFFREHFATVGHALPLLSVIIYFEVILMHSFTLYLLYCSMGG